MNTTCPKWPLLFFLFAYLASSADARAGGGCFIAGTQILTPLGGIPIETLAAGDIVFGIAGEDLIATPVLETFYTLSPTILIVTVSGYSVQTTSEHPFMLPDGSFKLASELSIGDQVVFLRNGNLRAEAVSSIEAQESEAVYNLDVGYPSTFVANGFVVHNKGGSSIRSHSSHRSISRSSHRSSSRLSSSGSSSRTSQSFCGWEKNLTTPTGVVLSGYECIVLKYPANQSSSLPPIKECAASSLNVWSDCEISLPEGVSRELVFTCSNSQNCDVTSFNLDDGTPVSVKKPLQPLDPAAVGGIAILGTLFFFFPFAIFVILVAFFLKRGRIGNYGGNKIDYNYSSENVKAKAAATDKLLAYLNGIDKNWEPSALKEIAKSTFIKMQQCWEARDYSQVEPLLMPYLFKQHLEQIQSLKNNHEINKLEGLSVISVDVVHLRHYAKKEQQEFTALVSARARDYYIDDRSGNFIRGDKQSNTFQEFFVFQRQDDRWLLREIDQAGESSALSEKNFVEELTDLQLAQICGKSDIASAPAAPFVPLKVDEKADKVHRLLNHLSPLDKAWDEDFMKESARRAFIGVLSSFEKQSLKDAEEMLMPQAIKTYSDQIGAMVRGGASVEYRNMCVRKVDIVLVRNFTDGEKDEFTARIAAHAQKIEKVKGKISSRDSDVTPFEALMTFQKQSGVWKLRESEPSSSEGKIISSENVDEESSKEMLEWYYTKDRAM